MSEALSGNECIVLVLSEAVLVLLLECSVMTEPTFDHEKLDGYRLSIEYAAASYGIAKSPLAERIESPGQVFIEADIFHTARECPFARWQ